MQYYNKSQLATSCVWTEKLGDFRRRRFWGGLQDAGGSAEGGDAEEMGLAGRL